VLVARLIGVFVLIAMGILFAAYLLTSDRRYLAWARRLVQFAVVFAIAFMALYVVERLVLAI
jgi:hypothetical protein